MKKLQIANPITPNQLQQATAELKGLNLGSYTIPTEIQEEEKEYYVCVGVNANNSNPMSPTYSGITRFITKPEWDRQAKDLKSKSPIFTMMLANVFNKVVILHNPTMKLAPVIKKKVKKDDGIKPLSPKQKKEVNDLMEEGKGEDDKGLDDIANEVGVTFERVKAYIVSGVK